MAAKKMDWIGEDTMKKWAVIAIVHHLDDMYPREDK